MPTHLKVGDQAPQFSINNQKSEAISLESLKGKKAILFFYPKDNTPGCTAEACSLRDEYQDFRDAGYEIYGISPDSEKKHVNFINKFQFPFDLLADVDQEMLKAFGVWGPKSFMGKSYIGVHRSTFVLDEEGVITHIVEKVKTKTHSAQLKELIQIEA